jgi:hypothetical protein
MWPHFVNLLVRIIHGAPGLVSSNWAASFLGLGAFSLTELLLYMTTPKEERAGRLRTNLVIGVLVTIFVYSVLFVWSTIQTVYDDHHDSTGRWQAVVKEKDSLKMIVQQRDEYIQRLEARTCRSCPDSSGKGRTTETQGGITTAMASVRMICSLRDSSKVPEDLLLSVGTPNASYLEGDLGKSYMESTGIIHYQRTEEDGKASVFQKYSLPSNSDLIGQRFSHLTDYKTLTLNIYGAEGRYFSSCQFYEVTFRVNGQDIYRTSGTLPGGKATIDEHGAPTIVLYFRNLDLPK